MASRIENDIYVFRRRVKDLKKAAKRKCPAKTARHHVSDAHVIGRDGNLWTNFRMIYRNTVGEEIDDYVWIQTTFS